MVGGMSRLTLALVCASCIFAQRPSNPALLVPQDAPALDYVAVADPLPVPATVMMGASSDVAFDSKGHLYVLSRGAQPLTEFDENGKWVRSYGDGFLAIDYPARRVSVGSRDVALTPLEFRLLCALVEHRNQVLPQEQLLAIAWGEPKGGSEHKVKLYIGYLRRKLDPAAPEQVPIETVRGFGYRYRTA